MRNKIIQDTEIEKLLDFGSYLIFDTADIQTMVMIFRKNNQKDNYSIDFRKIIDKEAQFKDLIDLLNKKENLKLEYLNPIIKKEDFFNNTFNFSNDINEKILSKIKNKGNIFLNEDEIANGIHPHYDFINKRINEKHNNKFKIGEGIFALSNEEKNNIYFTNLELDLIKPYYTSKELNRYYSNKKNNFWLIYTDSKFKNPENIKPYPNIKKHLDKFLDVITSDNKPYGLHRAREENFFKGEKIIALRKCAKQTSFTYTDFDCYVSATFYVIKTNRVNQKYLTALLNSKLIAFWLRHKGKMQGNNYQIDKEPLLAIPIFNPLEQELNRIVEFVNKIFSLTSSDDYLENSSKQSQVKTYEREIDLLVYKLYDLTEDEISIIEGD